MFLTACVETAPLDVDDGADAADPERASEADLGLGKADAAKGSACPTAPENWPLSHFWWKTSRYPERYVWTPDGSRLLGVEVLYEERKSWDPLNGSTDKRKTCHRLFLIDLDGKNRQNLGAAQPLQGGEVFAYPKKGYALVQLFRPGALDFVRVALDGAHTTLGTASGDCVWGRALPSPDGAAIALVRTTQPDCESGGVATQTEVRFFTAAGAPGAVATVAHAGFAQATWTKAGSLVVTDGAMAVRVASDGQTSSAPLPGCTEPPTSSSEVDATGRIIGISEQGQPVVVGVDPTRAFGCQ
jgi:hypothetical protein